MALSYKQTQLIRSTIPLLQSDGDRVTEIFYASLLAAHPDLRHIYNPTNQSSRRQPRAFTAAILTFAQYAGLDTSTLAAKLERVCQKHCSLGIRPHHYPIVGEFLLKSFADVLGPDVWTKDIRDAWAAAYNILAKMLMGRERILYEEFGRWEGWRGFKVVRRVEEDDGKGDVVSFYLKPGDGGKLPMYKPGQYITLQMWVPTAGCFQSRQFALSDAPSNDYYRITIQRDRGGKGPSLAMPREPLTPTSPGRDGGCPHPGIGNGASASGCPYFGNYAATGSSSSGLVSPSSSRPQSKEDKLPARGRPGVISNLLLDHRRVGDAVELTHPAGEFYLDPANTSSLPLVLISAGIGAAPLVAMLNTVAQTQPDRPVSWIHGRPSSSAASSLSSLYPTARHHPSQRRHGTPAPALFESHVRALTSRCKGLRVSIFESSLAGADNVGGELEERKWESESERTKSLRSWDQRTGRSSDDGASEEGPREDISIHPEPEEEEDVFWGVDGENLWLGNSGTEYFVCGPEVFMRGVAKGLQERGVKGSNVKFELLGTGDFHFGW